MLSVRKKKIDILSFSANNFGQDLVMMMGTMAFCRRLVGDFSIKVN